MPRTNHTSDVGNGSCTLAISPRPHQQNVYPLNEAAKLTLDDVRATLDRYGEVVSEVRRRFALLSWRGALDAADGGTSELATQRAIGTYLAHAAALAELTTKLQLECEAASARDQSLAESTPRSRNNA
jgi:hypothetical protein